MDVEVAKYLRTGPDGVKFFEYGGDEVSEAELKERLARQHERKRLLEEWKQSLELPDHDAWKSDEALRRLGRRGIYQPTQEEFLRELEQVKPESGEAA
jgi:hypothetical protein